MTFQVKLLPRAALQLHESALWWAERHSTVQAVEWLERFEAALRSLAQDPDRWNLAAESAIVGLDIREMTFGMKRTKTHRAVFGIRHNEVIVYAIRHLAQDQLTADDF